MDSGILEISACFTLGKFLEGVFLKEVLLNYAETYFLKDLLLLLVTSLSQPAL